jgi:hypothetical protein
MEWRGRYGKENIMGRLSLWRGGMKGNDYRFYDRTMREMIYVGGVGLLIHKYIGPVDQGDTGDDTQPATSTTDPTTSIQDLLFLENRDLNYDPDVYELRGVYNVLDTEFNLTQFGVLLQNGTFFITFHYNEMVEKIGRTLMAGDVLELQNLREDLFLNGAPPANAFYVIQQAARSAEGFSPTWWYHLWRVQVTPITDSQEYASLLAQVSNDRFGNPAGPTNGSGDTTTATIGSILSTYGTEIGISDAILAEAEKEVPFRNFQGAQFYVVPHEERNGQYPWVYLGDGQPPNGASLAGRGAGFPNDPTDGEYWLRTDFEPYVLFKYYAKEGRWLRQEIDWRRKWEAANRLLVSFLNNDRITQMGDFGTPPGLTFPEKQPISKAILPRADVNIIPPALSVNPPQAGINSNDFPVPPTNTNP